MDERSIVLNSYLRMVVDIYILTLDVWLCIMKRDLCQLW